MERNSSFFTLTCFSTSSWQASLPAYSTPLSRLPAHPDQLEESLHRGKSSWCGSCAAKRGKAACRYTASSASLSAEKDREPQRSHRSHLNLRVTNGCKTCGMLRASKCLETTFFIHGRGGLWTARCFVCRPSACSFGTLSVNFSSALQREAACVEV